MPTHELPRYVVGIDVETTSLDPTAGDIIDFAAIRYDTETGQEVARLEHLCRPRQPLTAEIEVLTGITNAMVDTEPPFAEFREELKAFIGSDTLFAHNASFDLSWFQEHGLLLPNPVWDTFLVATVALPEVPSYNLGYLAGHLTIPIIAEHRAASDVQVTWLLLRKLQAFLTIPQELHHDVMAILKKGAADHYAPLFSLLKAKVAPTPIVTEALKTPEHESRSVAVIIGSGGLLEHSLPGFTARVEQLQMAEAVAQVVEEGGVGLIEAGTGTGKTYAYLVPLLLRTERPLVVATHTKHLQDQLVSEDLPKLLKAMNQTRTVAVLKGRRNYICEARLKQILARDTFTTEEAFLLIKIQLWLNRGGTGDIERLNTSHQGTSLLRLLHADSLSCRTVCSKGITCPYQAARHVARRADIIVVNHALLMQAAHSRDAILTAPVVVIDEAHHLEEAARGALRVDFSQDRVAETLAPILHLARQGNNPDTARHINEESESLLQEYREWLQELEQFVSLRSERQRILLDTSSRQSRQWQQVAAHAQAWRGRLKFMLGLSRSVAAGLSAPARLQLTESIQAAEHFNLELERFIEGDAERIQWLEVWESGYGKKARNVSLNDVPLSVAPLVASLTSVTRSLILTSATLTVAQKFDYIKSRLGLLSTLELQLPSPFNERDNMLIYLVDDAPHPSDPAFERYVAETIENVALRLNGRVLGLFTAQVAVAGVYKRLLKSLNKATIRLLAQKMTGGRRNILERFRTQQPAVLLGTASFWEGVDVVGDSLSCVVIPRLPFPAPDDPVHTAQAQHEQRQTFSDFAIPHMVLRLRQGIGRLLRSMTDEGVVVILDSRLHQKEYGDQVLKSLPPATIHIGSRHDVLPTILDWFGKEKIEAWNSSEPV